jgi:hypothetical protein
MPSIYLRQRRDSMRLKDYLYFNEIKLRAFAESVDCTYNHMALIVRGQRKPGLELAMRISKETGGEVSVMDIRGNKADEKYREIFGE